MVKESQNFTIIFSPADRLEMVELIHLVLIIILIAFIIREIKYSIEHYKCKKKAKHIIDWFPVYQKLIIALIAKDFYASKDSNLKERLRCLSIIGNSPSAKQIANHLTFCEVKYIISKGLSYFKTWQHNIQRISALNQKYPLAILSLSKNVICIPDTHINALIPLHLLNEDDLLLLSEKTTVDLVSMPLYKIELSQNQITFLTTANRAFQISAYQGLFLQGFLKDVEPLRYKENPFTHLQFHPKEDYAEIAQQMLRRGVLYLYHFTDKKNISSIIKHGGLYSWAALTEKKMDFQMGGNELSHKLDCRLGLQDYVRLSSNKMTPMQYRLEEKGHNLSILVIHPIVALLNDTLFSNMNATDNKVVIGGTSNHISGILTAASCGILRRDDKRFAVSQSEILVKHFIPLQYIINI